MHNQPRIKSRLSCKKRDYTYVGIAEENVYYSVQKCVNIILVSISICLQRFFFSVVHLFVYDCMLNTNFLLFECFALCDFYFEPIGWPSECDTFVDVLPRNTMTTLCRITYSLWTFYSISATRWSMPNKNRQNKIQDNGVREKHDGQTRRTVSPLE